MGSHTKKIGSLGRYGTRTGRKPRYEALKIENEARKASKCPNCSRGMVKRKSAGVWKCRTCDYEFTGGTHISQLKRKISQE
jgi:large subunit ribosomal protein L37Ae